MRIITRSLALAALSVTSSITLLNPAPVLASEAKDAPNAAAKTTQAPTVNPDMARILGELMVRQSTIGKFPFSEAERNAFSEGVMRALDPSATPPQFAELEAQFSAYMQGKMADAKAAELAKKKESWAKFPAMLDTPLITSQNAPTTLKKLAEDKKALLIDFWATWCGPCIQLMPSLQAKATSLAKHNIRVIAMNTEDAEKAEAFRVEKSMKMDWLVEPADRPFSRAFMIESIPQMMLVKADGTVVFQGHPQDPLLNQKLIELGVPESDITASH